MKNNFGVIVGRFQPFHLHHLRYALAARKLCEHLVVGITNPDDSSTKVNHKDLNRSLKSNNPLNYFERMLVVRESLLASGLIENEFSIIPFPINKPEYIAQYTPEKAKYFLTIYDLWGEEKKKILESLGLNVEVLWNKDVSEKGINATEIRKNIVQGVRWEHDLISSAAQLMKSMQLDTKIKESFKGKIE